MTNGLYSALSGAVAQMQALDVVANNVANANTTGFRAERITFHEVLASMGGSQVAAARGSVDDARGPIVTTGRALDLAVRGNGTFVVRGPHGVTALRSAGFLADADGRLVDAAGRALVGEDLSPILVPIGSRDIRVGADGSITADGEGAGRLLVASSVSPSGDVEPVDDPEIVSGALEGSNVSVVHSMVDLISVSRAFEALTKMIENYRTIDERTAREVGNPR